MKPAGLILAGGVSSRMGSPKALLRMPGSRETFLDRLIAVLSPACSSVTVVLGHAAEEIREQAAGSASFVVNPEYERGQLSSLQCGLRVLPKGAPGVMFTPVDHPGIRPETALALAEAFERRAPGAVLIVPRHGGRRGHPVVCARETFGEFLALGPEAQARDVIHRHACGAVYVDVEDPGIAADIDDPEAYRRFLAGAEGR